MDAFTLPYTSWYVDNGADLPPVFTCLTIRMYLPHFCVSRDYCLRKSESQWFWFLRLNLLFGAKIKKLNMRQIACFSKNQCEVICINCLTHKDRQSSAYTIRPKSSHTCTCADATNHSRINNYPFFSKYILRICWWD